MKHIKEIRSGAAPVLAGRRLLFLALGAVSLIGAAVCGGSLLMPKTSTNETIEYSYTASADCSYRVKLLPNELYEEEWMEEGKVYSSLLTDQIEVTLNASFAGSAMAQIEGSYTVTGVVEGYQEAKDSKKIIYEHKVPLLEGSMADDGKGGALVQEQIILQMGEYKQFADQADVILGAAPSRQFYLLFEGDFKADTQFGKSEEPFSLSLQIPLQEQGGFYEIKKPEPFVKPGQIGTNTEVKLPPDPIKLFPVGLWMLLSLAGILWVLLFTRSPDQEELYVLQVKELLRKYGNRMVRMNQMDERTGTGGMEVSDIENLLMIAEEIRRPVCYSLDDSGMPQDGILYVSDGDRYYILKLVLLFDHTTLEVQNKDESNNPNGET